MSALARREAPAESGVQITRDQRRSRRAREVRSASVSPVRVSLATLRLRGLEAGLGPEINAEHPRPLTRGECEGGERPCPFVSCRHHLYLDVSEVGSVKLNFPDLEVWELKESCSLDLADRDGLTLQDVGDALNLTRERVRQIESSLAARVREGLAGHRAIEEERADGKRRLPLLPEEPSWLDEERPLVEGDGPLPW